MSDNVRRAAERSPAARKLVTVPGPDCEGCGHPLQLHVQGGGCTGLVTQSIDHGIGYQELTAPCNCVYYAPKPPSATHA